MKIALFDVDGTILNSMGAWENLGRRFLLKKGIDVDTSLNHILYPMTSLQAASYLKNQYHLEDSIQEIMEAFHQDFYDYYANEVPLKEGIIEVLNVLKENGYSLYIATASTRELVSKSFQRLNIDHYFEDIFTCNELQVAKSDHQFYQLISLRLNKQPHDMIVFEDNSEAAKAAKSLGMYVIGIYDKHCRGDLKQCANTYITKWEELFDANK